MSTSTNPLLVRWRQLLLLLALCLLGAEQPASAQAASSIVVSIDGKPPIRLTVGDLRKLPMHSVSTVDVKETIKYEGAAVADVLTAAGLLFGQNMRGERLQSYLLVESADRYRVVYALPEVDRQFSDGVSIIAYQRDGKAMSEFDGAFRFVHAADKRHARWVRNVAALTVQSPQ